MSMIGKRFIDDFDKNRMLEPVEERGRDFLCRVYIKEPKFLRQKVQRENEDGELEWYIVNSEIPQNFNYIGMATAPVSLFHTSSPAPSSGKRERFSRDRDDGSQLHRIGYRMM